MKRTQRLSIEIQHREVVIAVSGPTLEGPEEISKDAGSVVPRCICGSPWVLVAVHGGDEAATSAIAVHRALEQAGLHLHVAANGELSICRKSLEDLKEKR
jgi:hypothetical protein